tara:strand:- start:192 stop:608 length:417 start_codon:yes stop_codon:yes gene_type:complete
VDIYGSQQFIQSSTINVRWFTTRDVAGRFKVTERTIRRWKKNPEFNAEITRLNNNRSVLISKLLDELSIASLSWALNYINDISGNANVKVKIFSKLNSLSSACYEESNDTEDDIVLFQTVISELDKLADLKRSSGFDD